MSLSFFKIRKETYFILLLFCFPAIINAADSLIKTATTSENIIDLGSNYFITSIEGTKVNSDPYNYLLGIFEGSTDGSFSDGLPIAMIKEDVVNDPSTISITANCKKAYRYIRYLPPNGNNAQLSDVKIIGNPDTEGSYYRPTNLPLMVIKTVDLEEPASTEVYINSTVIIINTDGDKLEKPAEIRVRGHQTAAAVKKPWKIKFHKKQQVLDIDGEYKSWAVLANHYDTSFIRNHLAFEISRKIDLPFTPRCRFIDVIMNGNFRGNYYICDQVEVKSGRVDIGSPDDDDITGGYLIEFDSHSIEEEKYFLSEKGLVAEIKDPDSDDITEDQESYIKSYLNEMEKSVYNGYLNYIDLYTFYRYFIIQEFCADVDTVLSSFHVTKRKGDNKLYFGPVWDYDRSFDNDDRLIPTNEKTQFAFNYGPIMGTLRDFIRTILVTNSSISYINKTWFELRENILTFDYLNNYITTETNKILPSVKLNYYRWFGSRIENVENEYKSNVAVVINFVKHRFDRLIYLINNYDFAGVELKINFSFLLLLILCIL